MPPSTPTPRAVPWWVERAETLLASKELRTRALCLAPQRQDFADVMVLRSAAFA